MPFPSPCSYKFIEMCRTHFLSTDINDTEYAYASGRQRCLQVLSMWKENEGDNVTSGQLVRALKYLRLRELASENSILHQVHATIILQLIKSHSLLTAEVRKMTTYH